MGVGLGALALVLLAWAAGLGWFVADIPRALPVPPGGVEALEHTDAIVVLTGGSGRLTSGLDLLSAGAARKLFVSGVYDGVDVRALLHLSKLAPSQVECCVALGHAAENTIGNAYETADWMREQGYTSLRLVTANYHMRRALLEFRLAMPRARILPYPVDPPNVSLADWWTRRGTASLLITEYNKYLLARLRGGLEKTLEN